tara:strand:+ start:585 stop:3005 length:2421 start_codon:yes stop_codon:yes gene_type:complete
MKKKLIKIFLIFFIFLFLVLIYLSVIGLETKKFNNQIKDQVNKIDKDLNLELNNIKLILDLLNFNIKAKTVGSIVLYQNKPLELEYIKTQISLSSLIKNKIISSNLEVSSKSLLFKDFIRFVRGIKDTPQLFIFQNTIEKGHIIFDLKLNFDEKGKIKSDYELKGLLKDVKINFFNQNIFENINFNFNLRENNYLFQEIKLKVNKVNFTSDIIRGKKKKNNFLLEGRFENKKYILNKNLIKLLNLDFPNINLEDTSFKSNNKFSLEFNNKFDIKNLELDTDLIFDQFNYVQPDILNKYLLNSNEIIIFRDHNIKLKYINNKISIEGIGKVKLGNNFNDIEYFISKKENNFNLISNINLEKLNLKKNRNLQNIFFKINDQIILSDQKINIEYKNKNLLVSGKGKIKLDKVFEDIDYIISKKNKITDFNLNLNLTKTKFKLTPLNYKKKENSKFLFNINGNYHDNKKLIINNFSILEDKNKIILKNLVLGKNNLIIQVDEIKFDYIDTENKINKLTIKMLDKYNYEVNGLLYNANTLITKLLSSENNLIKKIFKNNISLNLNIEEVFIDELYFVKNLEGNLFIKNNKVNSANFSANFKNKDNITFTIKTDDIGNKITTLSSSWAKPLVNRYKFIKGFDEGNLDFVSYKQGGKSESKLIIDNFKVKEIPALAKLLSLASLQGIADLLTGEGLRFTDFEMNFTNEKNLIRVKEIYAIGPSISILLEGYVEKDKLISLRGTLVPATTINRTISSIPLIGDLLVGKKAGEGVFGVSFKVKGPPEDLATTVNPIKTLTPRFITRTIEKIKKIN